MKINNRITISVPNEPKRFLDIIIPEQPIAMQRPRLGKGHTYNPQAVEKVRLGWIFKEAMMKAHKNCTDKPLSISAVFSFKRVKSNKRRYHTATPDLDNVIKFYLDCMQGGSKGRLGLQGDGGICYFNDSQIVELKCAKGYADKPSVHIVLYEI